ILDVGSSAQLMHAPFPVAQLLFAVRVVEREHGGGMFRLHESFARLAAHTLRRGVGRNQLRMVGFEPLELVHQRVERGVRNFRRVQHVIAILVMPDLLAQGFDLLLDGGTGHDWGIIVRGGEFSVPSSQFSVNPQATIDKPFSRRGQLRRANLTRWPPADAISPPGSARRSPPPAESPLHLTGSHCPVSLMPHSGRQAGRGFVPRPAATPAPRGCARRFPRRRKTDRPPRREFRTRRRRPHGSSPAKTYAAQESWRRRFPVSGSSATLRIRSQNVVLAGTGVF